MSQPVIPDKSPKRQAIRPADFDIFVGLDTDHKSMAVTLMDPEGQHRCLKMPYDADNLLAYVRNRYPGARAVYAYEAGPMGFGLYDHLTKQGETCLLVHPTNIPQAPSNRVKTNRRDSKQLASALRGGSIEGIRVPEEPYRSLRHLTQLRNHYAEQTRAYKQRIKALLLVEGLEFPPARPGSQWTRAVLSELSEMPASPMVRFKLDCLLANLRFVRLQSLGVRRQILRLCKSDADLADSMHYLGSLPGVGWVIGTSLLARIGDWRGLRDVDELAAFCGLVPTEHSTGEHVQRGSISGSGDQALRAMLIEGAWSAIRQDAELAAFFQRIKARHPRDRGARIGIVAVARKLTARIYAVLTERREYVLRPPVSPSSSEGAA